MKLHILKIAFPFAQYVASGEKSFEFRNNDRDFKVDDLIRFCCPKTKEVFRDMPIYQIEYILSKTDFDMVPEGWIIFSIKPLRRQLK